MTGSEDSTLHPSAPIRNTTNICSSTHFAQERQLSGRQIYGKQLDTIRDRIGPTAESVRAQYYHAVRGSVHLTLTFGGEELRMRWYHYIAYFFGGAFR
jgi:hypothetical protein